MKGDKLFLSGIQTTSSDEEDNFFELSDFELKFSDKTFCWLKWAGAESSGWAKTLGEDKKKQQTGLYEISHV